MREISTSVGMRAQEIPHVFSVKAGGSVLSIISFFFRSSRPGVKQTVILRDLFIDCFYILLTSTRGHAMNGVK